MYEDVTGSTWSHLDGSALAGPEAGSQLPILALQTTTWAAWVDEHPETTVLDVATGYEERYRDTTNLGRSGIGRGFLATLDGVDERLPESTLVIGVLAGAGSAAFPIEAAPGDSPMQAEVGGVPVVVLEDEEGMPSLAYHRKLSDGTVLSFERLDGAVYDVQTGSRWSSSGVAESGELAGVQLTFVTSFFTESYGWAAFHPETLIYGSTL